MDNHVVIAAKIELRVTAQPAAEEVVEAHVVERKAGREVNGHDGVGLIGLSVRTLAKRRPSRGSRVHSFSVTSVAGGVICFMSFSAKAGERDSSSTAARQLKIVFRPIPVPDLNHVLDFFIFLMKDKL